MLKKHIFGMFIASTFLFLAGGAQALPSLVNSGLVSSISGDQEIEQVFAKQPPKKLPKNGGGGSGGTPNKCQWVHSGVGSNKVKL